MKQKTVNKYGIVVRNDFSTSPGPRYIDEGDYSGELFRQTILKPKIVNAIEENYKLNIDLDGTAGYGTSFLEEAFGGLVRTDKIKYDDIIATLVLKSVEEPDLIDEINGYLKDADNER